MAATIGRDSEAEYAGKSAGPCVFVLFGAAGDLTKRKLVPALLNLVRAKLLPDNFAVLGVSVDDLSLEDFRNQITEFLQTTDDAREDLEWFRQRLFYERGDFADANTFSKLRERLSAVDLERHTEGNYLFYLATAPKFFAHIVQQRAKAGLSRQENGRWRRVVIEKPFGHDLDSARALNRDIKNVLQENQIYRIDHYLGKETVQNVLVFRFANGIFEPIWNRRYVDHVQITVAEDIGIERRGKYYETAGALRDIFQNHLMQLVSIAAMEAPPNFDADSVRDEKVKVLKSIHPIDVANDVVRGQYGPGWVGGQQVPGYRQELNVSPTSNTETFVAVRLKIDNWRWADTPVYLRTGNRLPSRASEIAIQFKNPPHLPFAKTAVQELTPNVLVMRIQPHEGASLKIAAKIPGPVMRLRTVNMDFFYGSSFMVESPDAYERLVLDCMLGDATLFAREDEVERAWGLVDRIEGGWASQPPPVFPNYDAGTWGPPEADALIERDGRRWRRP